MNIPINTNFTLSDAIANPSTVIEAAALTAWNGTTWERLKTAQIGNNITGLGLLTSVGYGQYNATAPTITTAQYTALQTDINGSLKTFTQLKSSDLSVTTTAAVNTITTLTLPAAGAGLFHYITHIEIECYATAARVGAAAPTIVTSTNLVGTPSWNFTTAQAIGVIDVKYIDFVIPIKSAVANTATTIVGPATASVIWKIKVWYYTGV